MPQAASPATESPATFHGDWYLAWAGYNAGEGRISRAIRKERTTDFWRMTTGKRRSLRAETRHYVPKLIAAAVVAKQPERFGITPPVPTPFEYDSLVVSGVNGLDVIARLAGVSLAEIRELNPQYLRLATPPRSQSVIRLPAGSGEKVAEAYADQNECDYAALLQGIESGRIEAQIGT